MKLPSWSSTIRALVLIKVGQELGCGGRYAVIVHDCIDLALCFFK